MRTKALCLAVAVLPVAGLAQEGDAGPRSAIGWLSESIATPPAAPLPPEPPVSQGAGVAEVQTQTLGDVRRDGVGLLSPAVTGLPRDGVAHSQASALVAVLDGLAAPRLPALAALTQTLLLAEMDPPRAGTAPVDAVFHARLDALLRFGNLEQAQALMERAGPTEPEIFRRWYDVSLLTGHDSHACNAMQANPDIAPTLPARIFCLSRTGDWAAAALTLDTGRALGLISPEDADLLALFLDPEMFEGLDLPAAPDQMTPLRFRLLDGVGETPPTGDLPVAFAVADLRPTNGWKARLEAAERLARAGAISPEQLRGLYTERMPAASGGVWDRAEAFQRFDVAMLSGDPGAIANALPAVWARLGEIGLDVPFARLYGERLSALPLSPAAQSLALKIGLLSDAYEIVALAALDTSPPPRMARDIFAARLALGEVTPAPPGLFFEAIAAGFSAQEMPARFALKIRDRRLVEALLSAIDLLEDGAQSDPEDISDALALFRLVGLHDIARRTALQLMLMER